MKRQLFVNLAVKDVAKSKAFFTQLGFEFDAKYSDDKAICMIVNESSFVMLLNEPFFKTFTKQGVCDTRQSTEALLAFSVNAREQVDSLTKKAVELGGAHAMPTQDHGFMYSWSFYDLDHHHWEVMWLDPNAKQ